MNTIIFCTFGPHLFNRVPVQRMIWSWGPVAARYNSLRSAKRLNVGVATLHLHASFHSLNRPAAECQPAIPFVLQLWAGEKRKFFAAWCEKPSVNVYRLMSAASRFYFLGVCNLNGDSDHGATVSQLKKCTAHIKCVIGREMTVYFSEWATLYVHKTPDKPCSLFSLASLRITWPLLSYRLVRQILLSIYTRLKIHYRLYLSWQRLMCRYFPGYKVTNLSVFQFGRCVNSNNFPALYSWHNWWSRDCSSWNARRWLVVRGWLALLGEEGLANVESKNSAHRVSFGTPPITRTIAFLISINLIKLPS